LNARNANFFSVAFSVLGFYWSDYHHCGLYNRKSKKPPPFVPLHLICCSNIVVVLANPSSCYRIRSCLVSSSILTSSVLYSGSSPGRLQILDIIYWTLHFDTLSISSRTVQTKNRPTLPSRIRPTEPLTPIPHRTHHHTNSQMDALT
jgi:hypothetical protein